MKSIFSSELGYVAKAMDLRLIRQNVVAGNLANVENPSYKARRFNFEQALQRSLQADEHSGLTLTSEKHLPAPGSLDSVSGELGKENEVRVVQGEDSVDLDKEMAIQAKNTMLYNVLAAVLQKDFSMIGEVISRGGE